MGRGNRSPRPAGLVAAMLLVLVAIATQGSTLVVTDPGSESVVPAETTRGMANKRDVNRGGAPTRHIRDADWGEGGEHDVDLRMQKRHLGAAMNMLKPSWLLHGDSPFYHRPVRFHTGDNNDSEFPYDNSQYEKRLLGSAPTTRFGGLVGLSEHMKRHLGAALKFRQLHQPRFNELRHMYRMGWNRTPPTYKDSRDSVLGSLYMTHSHGRRYRSNLREKRDVENIQKQSTGDDAMVDQDVVMRHIGAALYPESRPSYNPAGQSYHEVNIRNTVNDDSDSNDDQVIQNGSEAAEDLELYQRYLQKRHFGAALNLVKGAPKWKSDTYQNVDDEKRNTEIGEENYLIDLEHSVNDLADDDYQRHLDSAMQLNPEQLKKTPTRDDDTEEQDFDEDYVDKRHLGAALGLRVGNKADKRHIGSALSAGKQEDADGDSSDEVKRHLGSARHWAPGMGKRHFGAARNVGDGKVLVRQGKRHIGSEPNHVSDLSTIDYQGEEVQKRHLGSVMKWASGSNNYQHVGELRNAGNSRYWVRHGKRMDDDRNIGAKAASKRYIDEDGTDKRHIGAAMAAGKREIDDDEIDKHHIGAAIAAGKRESDDDEIDKRHIGAAMAAGKRESDDDAIDKRHIGAAMAAGKRESDDDEIDERHIGAAMAAGKRESDDDEIDKRHIGAAMAAGKRESNDDEIDKRHIGAAMAAGKRESDDDEIDERHIGAAMAAGKRESDDDEIDKRHIGAAMAAGKRESDDDEIDKRHIGAAMAAGKRESDEIDKHHIGAAMAAGKRESNDDEIDKRHIGSAMKFKTLQSTKEKRHLGSAMKFRNPKNTGEKRRLGVAMKFKGFQKQQEKRHLGSAMKFRNFKSSEEKRHLGAAMKFRKFQTTQEKRHLEYAMKPNSNQDFKRIGSSMNFGRWSSSSRPRIFGGPFNVQRLNPLMGEKKRGDLKGIEEDIN